MSAVATARHRAKAEAQVLNDLEEILPGSQNKPMYQAWFKTLSDQQFDDWIVAMERGETRLSLISPIQSTPQLDVKRNLATVKRWGHNCFERIWMPAKSGAPSYLSNIPYLVLLLPLRRQAQHMVKKRSIPEDNRTIDDFTGQPAGRSKGSKISYPEVNVLATHGLDHTTLELIRWRGGDLKGFYALNQSVYQTGQASQDALADRAGEVTSTQTLRTILKGMMLKTTL